jgi:hypothetical protein
MPFDFKAEMEKHFPKPRAGEWIPCEFGLPDEFALVVFVVDDRSEEGMHYLGYLEDGTFRAMYMSDVEPFRVHGRGGVKYWMVVPERRDTLHDRK